VGEPARSIQIDEDPTFQRHQMRFERIGWGAIAVILLAALVGFFGNGPLSAATAGDAGDPIRVRYERLDRKSNPTQLTIVLAPEAATEGRVRVAVDRAWVDGVTIQRVEPEPESVEVASDHLVYAFAVQADAGPVEVIFRFEYENWGWTACEIGLEGGPTHAFGVLVFP
jgi:hypothetical protein